MNRTSCLLAVFAGLCLPAALPSAAFAQRRGPKEDKSPPSAPAQVRDLKDEKSQELGLAIGETKTIPAGDVKQYSEGTPGVVDVRLTPDGSKFIVVGQKSGSTSLLLIKNDGSQLNWVINVFSRSPELVERELQQLLEGYTGLRVRRVGSRLFIEGGVATEADQNRVKQIASLYSGQVESLVTVGSGAIDRKLNIRLDFFFVQYDKNTSYGVGISWPGRIGAEFIQSEFGYDFIGKIATAKASIVNQPLPGLDIASSRGWAKVLKQATVITTNGNEATFENGGEVNVQITSGFTTQIHEIQFGANISVLPRFDPATRNIEIKVKADMADLTPPSAGSPLPGRATSKLSTLVFLKLGQSLVLSGIRTRNERHLITGLPLLSRIPVLGVLFGSHSDATEETEGAVFIVPSVVESLPKSSYDIVNEAMKQYEDYSGDIDEVKSYPKTPPSSEAK
jgi:pilus assembly protein CpaC